MADQLREQRQELATLRDELRLIRNKTEFPLRSELNTICDRLDVLSSSAQEAPQASELPPLRELDVIEVARMLIGLGFQSGHMVSQEAADDLLEQFNSKIEAEAEPQGALKEAPPNSLPSWNECQLRVENSDFIAKRVAEGGHGPDADSMLATELHRFIYEYDDADPYRSAWFLHRLEKVIEEARTAIASAGAGMPKASAEEVLQAQGVFKGAHGLRGLAEAQEFWDEQPYGTRLQYGPGIADYLHRDVLRAAVKALGSGAADKLDAERYRWLRNPDTNVALVLDKRTGWVPPDDMFPGVGAYHTYEYRSGEELDAAIDAARQTQGSGKV